MKKTAIVSCYFQHNYGSVLQAYATQKALNQLGIENETIDIFGFNHEIKKAKLLYFIKASLRSDILLQKAGMAKNVLRRKLKKDTYSSLSAKRNASFDAFVAQYFRLSDACGSKKELALKCERDYSAVLVGSDQLWLPANIAADYYTLNFVPKHVNTIAYATSFGMATLPKDSAQKAKMFLPNIKHIGVREQSGQALVKRLVDRDVPVVCDPTLLFTGEEWMSIQQVEPIYTGNYILCYFLGKTKMHREFAMRLKEKTGCKIIALTHLDEYVAFDENYADETPYEINPADFVNLVRNATYVCTDSFHCSVFSILYHKDFFTFKRYANHTKQSTNSRLDTLFEMTGIQGRALNGDEDIQRCISLKTNFAKVEENLSSVRQASYQYLRAALEDKGSTDCD